MSGYEVKRNTSLNLMAGRLSLFGGAPERQEETTEETTPVVSDLDGLKDQQLRLNHGGGFLQQERMIYDKRRSLDRALLYSYQAANIKKVQCLDDEDNSFRPNIKALDEHEVCRALINPDKTKMDYDDKIISVHFEENFHSGDVFEWIGTNSYWMIYLQDLTEVAYFRGEIRRCSYEIAWEDEDGSHSTYAAVRGPVETKINYIQKHQISVDTPNYSLDIYLPRTEETLKYFRRYSKFYLKGEDEGSPLVCWRVEATDWISTPGILEITAVEYYSNKDEDDIENGVVGGLIVEPVNPNSVSIEATINGETFIKPKQVYEYYFKGINTSTWRIKETCPARFNIDPNDPLHIKLMWDSSYSGQFTLLYGSYEKVIVVESLY